MAFYSWPPISVSSSSPSTGTGGATAPTSATEVAGVDKSGILRPLATDASGTQYVNTADRFTSGTVSTTRVVVDSSGMSEGAIVVSGSFVGTIAVQGSADGTTWAALATQLAGGGNPWTSAGQTSPGEYKITGIPGYPQIGVIFTSYTSGTPTFAMNLSARTTIVSVRQTNQVNLNATIFQPTGTNLHAVIDSGTVSVSNFPASQAVTGTVTANQGTAGASAWKVDGSGVTQPVSGTVAVSNQPTTITVTQATGTNLHAVIDSGTIAATQSGTWTVQPGNTQNTTAWLTQDASAGPVTAGAVATKSSLAGGQFNTTLPTLTTGQQAAIQLDASGRQIMGTSAAVIGAVTQSGTWNIGSITSALPAGTNVIGSLKVGGKTLGNAPFRLDYTATNVTTAAYVQLIASTTAATSEIHFDDTSGQALQFATGASGSEVPFYILTPGGNRIVPFAIAAATRISVKALSATASVGDLCVNLLS